MWANSELELNNSLTITNGDSLRAVACTKFLQDVLKLLLIRFFGDEERFSNIADAISCHLDSMDYGYL